jgi:tyrosine-specific transport protein
MSSNLKFSAGQKSSFLGGALILAGTSIGAAMLALPMTSISFGFYSSLVLLIALWVFMTLAGFIILELSLFYGSDLSLPGIYEKALGKTGHYISSFSLGMLYYALLASYTTGGSLIVTRFIDPSLSVSNAYIAIAYMIVMAMVIFSRIRFTDYVNRILFIAKIAVFALIVYHLYPHVMPENLDHSIGDINLIWVAISVFFTSFGYHGSLPSVIKYLGKDPRKLRRAVILGGFIPLVVYCIWQAVTLGVIPLEYQPKMTNNISISLFIDHVCDFAGGKAAINTFTNLFAFLAISTSFLGVGLGLFDFIHELLGREETSGQIVLALLISFLPPLLFALFYPLGFIMALGFAGMALSLIAVVIPGIVSLKSLSHYPKDALVIPGGKILRLMMIATGIGLIVIELSQWHH